MADLTIKGNGGRMNESLEQTNAVMPAVTARPVSSTLFEVSCEEREKLVRLAVRFVFQREDAEDVVQDALTLAYRQRETLRDGSRWWGWIRRIVVNLCHEHGRRTRRRRSDVERLAKDALANEPTQSGGSNVTRESAEVIKTLLWELPRRQREVVVLRHLEQMNFDEIAELLGISPSTARVHAQAGREALRDLMLKRSAD